MRYPIIKVRDKLTGETHIVGTDTHDVLYVSDDGGIHYYNLQNGEGTGRNGDYEFVGVDNEFSPGPEIEFVLVDQTEVQRLRSLLERLDSYIDFSEHLSPGDWGIEDVTGINSLFDEVREALDGHDWAYVGKNPVQICRKCKKLWWEAEKICPGTRPDWRNQKMLTREKVLSMKPGRELDALVAEKVMNWKYFPAQVTDTFVRLDYFFDPVSGEAHHHWSPSADISAAWEVVEKMSEQWPQYQLAKIEDGWSVMWGFDGYGWPEATGKTAPEAICKAALLAVMGKWR